MKKIFLLIFMLHALCSNAQSFLGVELGMTSAQVQNILKQKYNFELEDGGIKIKECILGSIRLPYGFFKFDNDTLIEGHFWERTVATSYTDYEIKIPTVQNKYKNIVNQYTSKYGTPSFSSDTMVRWIHDGCTIAIIYDPEWRDVSTLYGVRFGAGLISIDLFYTSDTNTQIDNF